MKKILNIITLSETGGAQKIVYSIASGLKDDFEMSVACSPGGELVSRLRDKGVGVFELKEFRRGVNIFVDAVLFIKLYRLIKENHFDIVHCHSWKAGVIGRLAAFAAGCPCICFTVHGWSLMNSSSKIIRLIYIFIERLLGRLTDKIICVCEKDREQGIRLKIAGPEKFTVIYNGIEEKYEAGEPAKSKEAAKSVLPFPEGGTVIGTVARMAAPKQVLETARIMKALFAKFPKLYFVWVGGGPLYKKAAEYVRACGIEDRFFLAGMQDDVYSFLNSMDIYMLLSGYEGFSISILEAMNAGLPVIASNVGGVSEQVHDNVNGCLTDDSFDTILEKVSYLIENKTVRYSMGRMSRSIFLSKFTIGKMIDGYRSLYKE